VVGYSQSMDVISSSCEMHSPIQPFFSHIDRFCKDRRRQSCDAGMIGVAV
jgi:hypothetical protein